MKKLDLKKEVIISYIRMIVTVILGFVTVPLIINTIGKSQYGVLAIVLTVTSYATLMQFGLGQTVVRFIAKYGSEDRQLERQIVSATFLFYIGISILGLFAMLWLYSSFDRMFNIEPQYLGMAKKILILYSLDAIVTIPFTAFYSYMKSHNQFTAFNMTQITRAAARFALIFVLFKLGWGLMALVIVDIALNQAINLFSFFYSKIHLKFSFVFKTLDRRMLRSIVLFTFFAFIGELTDYFYWRTDNLILGMTTNTSTVAEYNASLTIIQYFKQFAIAVSGVTLPTLSMMTNEADRKIKINEFLNKLSYTQSLIIVPIVVGFWLFGKQFLNIWLHNLGFENAYLFAMIIIVPLGLVLIQSSHVNMLYAMNQHRLRIYVLIGSAVLNVLISVFLVMRIGAAGAALGTGIMLVIGDFIVVNFIYYKVIGFNIIKFFAKILPGMLFCIVPATIAGLLLRNRTLFSYGLLDLAAKGSVFLSLYLAGLYIVRIRAKRAGEKTEAADNRERAVNEA